MPDKKVSSIMFHRLRMTWATLWCLLICSLLSIRYTVLAEDVIPEMTDEEREIHDREERKERRSRQLSFVVNPLNDGNFEHQTQASTGQTTGSWLVWFHGNQQPQQRQLMDIDGDIPTLEDWSSLHTILATIDVDGDGRETAERIKVKSIPSFVYIHKGKMYAYPPKGVETYSWNDLLTFCEDPSKVSEAQNVPGPPSFVDDLLSKIASDPMYMMASGGVVIMVMVLILLVGGKTNSNKPKVS